MPLLLNKMLQLQEVPRKMSKLRRNPKKRKLLMLIWAVSSVKKNTESYGRKVSSL
jgi:hypothetical protein